MDDCINEVIRRGLVHPDELKDKTLTEIAIEKGWISPDEIKVGVTICDVLRKRGIIDP